MIFSKVYRLLLIFLTVSIYAPPLVAQDALGKISRICIDPGHGGRDPGAVNGKIKEKDISLAIALKLGERIRTAYPEIEVVYTRKSDVAVDLRERGRIANKAKAQLFISIHGNNFKNTSAKGVETFVLGLHKSQASLEVAMKENAAIRYEEDYSVKYDGFDPARTESYILFNLMKNAFLANSLELATPVQRELVGSLKMTDREVKQAGFIVLLDVAMPAVLVEVGFMSNPDDLKILTSPAGQQRVADAIFTGFSAYKEKMERNSVVIASLPAREDKGAETPSELFFAVQIASSAQPVGDLTRLGVKETVYELCSGGRYRYYVAPCAGYESAEKARERIRKQVKDCFVIAVKNGELISVKEGITGYSR